MDLRQLAEQNPDWRNPAPVIQPPEPAPEPPMQLRLQRRKTGRKQAPLHPDVDLAARRERKRKWYWDNKLKVLAKLKQKRDAARLPVLPPIGSLNGA